MAYDLVIRDGFVVDGTGASRFRADVAVEDGRIARVGIVPERGRTELNAEGHVVTPGFIDCHTHMDAQIMWDPLGRCSCYHGVTTVTMGNCGFTLAPAGEKQRELVVRNLERAEDMSPEALASGLKDWTWETFAEYLDVVDSLPKGINYAAYIGHSALRTWAMGERAFEGPARPEDLDRMERELRSAITAGAIGFSTSRSASHETSDNRPVASRLASWDELHRLAGTMQVLGTGMFQLALGEDVRSADPVERRAAKNELRKVALSGIPVTFNVFPRTVDGSDWKDQLDFIDETVTAGGRMFGQSSSRGVSVLLSFKTRLPFDSLPEWRQLRSQPLSEQRRLLTDPAMRHRLVEEANHGNYGRAIGAEARKPDYGNLRVMERPIPPYPLVADVARERSVDPVEVMIDLALEHDFDQFFIQPLSAANDDFLYALMSHPRMVMTFSDSGAHVSQIMDSSIQTHLLGYWVRELERLSLEEAIRMVTLEPALAWGFNDRGILREGMAADLNVIDPATVGPEMPSVADDLPGGAQRLDQRARGILATIVAGQVVLHNGESTGALPGTLVRGPLAQSRRVSN